MTSMYNLLDNKTLFNNFLRNANDGDGDDGNMFLSESICSNIESPTTALYNFITNGILLNIIGFLGILGNICCLIFLSRPQMRSSINYILIALVRMDTILIIGNILLFGIPGIPPYTSFMIDLWFKLYSYILLVVYPVARSVQTASIYLTLLVSMDRFLAICHPLRSRSLCTVGRAKIYIICVIVFSILYNIPRLWEASVISKWHERLNMTIYCLRPTKIRYEKTYLKMYNHWCHFILLYLFPFLSLAVLNVTIYIQMRKANRKRAQLSRLQRCKIGSAKMLICAVLVFFACNILPMIVNIIESFNVDMHADILNRMIETGNLLVTINSSLHFINYVIFWEKFKRFFLMLVCTHGRFELSGRDSRNAEPHNERYISNRIRTSLRLYRHGTSFEQVNCLTIRDSDTRRIHAPSPGFSSRNITARPPSAFTTQTSLGHMHGRRDIVSYDWSKSDQHLGGLQNERSVRPDQFIKGRPKLRTL